MPACSGTVPITDGHPTRISFAADATLDLKEVSITPPGLDMGDAQDTTDMSNSEFRTQLPADLKTVSECSGTCVFNPSQITAIRAIMGINNLITVTFWDNSTYAWWGWMQAFEPGEMAEGEPPHADFTVAASMQDNACNEVAPVYTAPPP